MLYCIWGDVHLRVDLLEHFINKNINRFDGWIFGGDMFHQFNDTVADNKRMALFIKERVLKLPNLKICLGNHDFCHKYSIGNKVNRLTYCPGWTEEKDKAINAIFTRDDWNQFKDYHLVDGWLISHAGFAATIYNHPIHGFNTEFIDKTIDQAYNYLTVGRIHPALDVGFGRGGVNPFGGHLWQCWSEIVPNDHKQIVFHTPMKHPDCKWIAPSMRPNEKYKYDQFGPHINQDNNTLTVCLDTNNRYYGILEDGYLAVDFVV